jgi:hypothetical protein
MDTNSIIAGIDAEIRKLEAARSLLAGIGKRGTTAKPTTRKKRKLSKAARAKIAAAQRKRWAAVRAKAKAK